MAVVKSVLLYLSHICWGFVFRGPMLGTESVVHCVTCLSMSAVAGVCLSRQTAGFLPTPFFPPLLDPPLPL